MCDVEAFKIIDSTYGSTENMEGFTVWKYSKHESEDVWGMSWASFEHECYENTVFSVFIPIWLFSSGPRFLFSIMGVGRGMYHIQF